MAARCFDSVVTWDRDVSVDKRYIRSALPPCVDPIFTLLREKETRLTRGNNAVYKPKSYTLGVLGHEAVAEIVDSRRTDGELKNGDRITFSITDSCGNCERCKNRLSMKCYSMKKYGHRELNDDSGFTGCYASHIVLDPGTAVYKVPDDVADGIVAPINCGLATMVNALSSIPTNDSRYSRAFIQGAGMLGVYGCVLLKEKGFETVFCSDVSRDRAAFVHNFGGVPVHEELCHSSERPSEDSIDVVVEVCGTPSVSQEGLKLLRPGGLYIFVGLVHPRSRLDISGELLVRKCLTLKGIHNYSPAHLQEALAFISNTRLKYPYEALISPAIDLKEFPTVIKTIKNHKFHRLALQP